MSALAPLVQGTRGSPRAYRFVVEYQMLVPVQSQRSGSRGGGVSSEGQEGGSPSCLTLRLPDLSMSKFCGLRSRCRILLEWRWARPSSSCCSSFCSTRRRISSLPHLKLDRTTYSHEIWRQSSPCPSLALGPDIHPNAHSHHIGVSASSHRRRSSRQIGALRGLVHVLLEVKVEEFEYQAKASIRMDHVEESVGDSKGQAVSSGPGAK